MNWSRAFGRDTVTRTYGSRPAKDTPSRFGRFKHAAPRSSTVCRRRICLWQRLADEADSRPLLPMSGSGIRQHAHPRRLRSDVLKRQLSDSPDLASFRCFYGTVLGMCINDRRYWRLRRDRFPAWLAPTAFNALSAGFLRDGRLLTRRARTSRCAHYRVQDDARRDSRSTTQSAIPSVWCSATTGPSELPSDSQVCE